MSGPQIWLCLFTFQPFASKQLNGLTTIDILSWLGGAVVTHPLWVQEVPCLVPGSGKGFYVWFFVLLLLCFNFFVQNTLFITKVCNSSYNINLFSILNILQDLWPIIRVLRYRPSIFKWNINLICIYVPLIAILLLTCWSILFGLSIWNIVVCLLWDLELLQAHLLLHNFLFLTLRVKSSTTTSLTQFSSNLSPNSAESVL